MKKAFTLIELLTVIAIIGILTGIVLVSVRTARIRAKDARIAADFDQMRTAAELFYDRDSSYVNFNCSSTTPVDVSKLCSDISLQNGGTAPTINKPSNNQDYCAYAPLASSGRWYCIAANGKAGETSTNPGSSACTTSSFNCP